MNETSKPEDFEKPLCGKCLYWQKHPTQLNLGICYRVPPIPVVVMTKVGTGIQMLRAMTSPEDACGLWVGLPDGMEQTTAQEPAKPTLHLV